MPVDPPQPPASELPWSRVLAWQPTLSDPQAHLGSWVGGREASAAHTMPSVAHDERVLAFVQELYDLEVVAPFDWGTWFEERGGELWEDPARLAGASLEECRMLLTAHVRADRFTEGHLLAALSSGHLVAVLERVRRLLEAVTPER